MNILILNGPNLNMLGLREPEVYGTQSMDVFLKDLQEKFSSHKIDYFQTNHEKEFIDSIQQSQQKFQSLVINPGAFSHYSLAVADAIRSISIPVIEVHLSNIYARETFRQRSYSSSACKGVICGFGLNSYTLAIQSLLLQEK